MDTEFTLRTETAEGSARACFPAFHRGTACTRCGGLMVGEYCLELPNGTGELEFLAARCVQCGEVVDPVILANRARRLAGTFASETHHNSLHHNPRRTS